MHFPVRHDFGMQDLTFGQRLIQRSLKLGFLRKVDLNEDAMFAGIEGIADGVHGLASCAFVETPPSQVGCNSRLGSRLSTGTQAAIGFQAEERTSGQQRTPGLLPTEDHRIQVVGEGGVAICWSCTSPR